VSPRSSSSGRVGHLREYPIHQATIGALLELQALGQLGPKLVAHPIRRQRPHLGIDSVNLIGQRAELLARRLWSDEFGHTATLSNTCAKHARPTPNLWIKTQLWITKSQHTKTSDLHAKRYAAHGMVAASDVPAPAGLLTDR
jgi:hypothetical protein